MASPAMQVAATTANRVTGRLSLLSRVGLFGLLACGFSGVLAAAESGGSRAIDYNVDIASFKLTDVQGFFRAAYIYDEFERDASYEATRTTEQEFFLDTRSFVYHPGLLNMHLGAGVLLEQQRFDTNLGSNDGNVALLNFATEFNFLDFKSYPFSVYFRRAHPSVTSSLSGRFLTEMDDYGIRGSLNQMFIPGSLRWGAGRTSTAGEGSGTITDEEVSQGYVGFDLPYRRDDRFSVAYDWNDRTSTSGSTGLPIQESFIGTRNTRFNAQNVFGENGGLTLRQNLNILEQDTIRSSQYLSTDLTYAGSLAWAMDAKTRANAQLLHDTLDRDAIQASRNEVNLAVNRVSGPNWEYGGEVMSSAEENDGFLQDRSGIGGTVRYFHPLSFGAVSVSASARGTRTDQESDNDRIQVFEERVVLVGTRPVDLRNAFVDATTVVVSNLSQTQVFVVDLDYRLIITGSVTSIQRLVDGNIADGQEVLVDYQYLSGGTVDYDTVNSALTLSLDILRFMNVYARYNVVDNTITGGLPTVPLNDVNRMEVGGRANVALPVGMELGGEYRYTDNQEDISSFTSSDARLSLQVPLPLSVQMLVSSAWLKVDVENSLEDTDLLRYELSLRARVFGGGQFGYRASYEEDTGGTLFREEFRHTLRYDWTYRQMRIFVGATYADETLGGSRRANSHIDAQLMRVF